MFKKMLPWMIVILVAITLIVLAFFVLWQFVMKDDSNASVDPNTHAQQSVEDEEPEVLPAKERMELTFAMENVITNLSDLDFIVKMNLAFQMNNKHALEELELIQPSVKAVIIRILSDTAPEEIQGSQGQDALVTKLLNQINPLLLEGKVQQIEITDIIIQES